MNQEVIDLLCCPTCDHSRLRSQPFSLEGQAIQDGVVWCDACHTWYAIDDFLLELLPVRLGYAQDRERFWQEHRVELERLGLEATGKGDPDRDLTEQQKQQRYFDQWAEDQVQSYHDFGEMPFWKAVKSFDIAGWRKEIEPHKWFLDIACAQGRTTFNFMDLPIKIVGFDISKSSIRQAIQHYRSAKHRADAVFLVGDASRIPIKPRTFDYIMLYGVLHHLPDPETTCRQLAQILRPGGIYFGTENNKSGLRPLFDFLQSLIPLWHEEAGQQPLISREDLQSWFAGTDVKLETKTHVFLPPHLVNLLGRRLGKALLLCSDWLLRKVPVVGRNGGLIMIRGKRAA